MDKKSYEEILREGKRIKEILQAEQGEVGIKIETRKATYLLLKSDGLKLHHSGYFIPFPEQMRFAQLFYAFTRVKTKNEEGKEIEEDRILPFLVEVCYNQDKIANVDVKPLNELEYIDLGETVAQLEKKTLGISSLPTQLPLEIVEKILKRKDLTNEPLNELQETFKTLKGKLLQHVEQNETVIDIAICWSIATYWAEVFGVMPLLVLIGVSGSGKTKFGTALSFIAKKGLGIADPTDANLSRVIDGFKPTLLIDDWDVVMRKKREIAESILKHVYKTTILIPRLTQLGKRFVVDMFSPYAPVIITTTEALTEPQLQRRVIELHCEKSDKRFPNIYNYNAFFLRLFESERKKLYEIMFLLAPQVFTTFELLSVDIPAPYSEIWIPILTIAKMLGEEVYGRIYEYAKKSVEEKEEEIYHEEKLVLQAINMLFEERISVENKKVDLLEFTTSELQEKLKEIVVSELKEIDERNFPKKYSIQKLGLILKRMGIKSTRKGKKRERKKEIRWDEFLELCKRLNFELADKSDDLYTCGKESNIEKTEENAIKTSNFESVGNSLHANNLSDMSDMSAEIKRTFLRLPEGYYGKCSYCGGDTFLEWIDSKGNHLCSNCRWGE